ncbi:MAG: hypothetical protein V3V08_22930 [Nannocystaceae bacterium]
MPGTSAANRKSELGFWARLQPRERNLVMGLLVVAVGMSLAVLFALRTSRFAEIETVIADQRRALELVYTGGASYKEKLAQKAAREKTISDKSLSFGTIIEKAAAAADIVVSDQGERPVRALGVGLKKRTYAFHLRDVTLEKLTKFLTHVETQNGHIVSTERLQIRSPSWNEDRLNRVDVEIATWERVVSDLSNDSGEQP